MENSYRQKLQSRNTRQQAETSFIDQEIDVVVKSTLTLLRRHNAAGKLCPNPRCGNDDSEACSVTKIDNVGFITEVKCGRCEKIHLLPTICRNPHCRYEAVEDPSSLVAGDHIAWHRPYLICHHAIVMEQDAEKITVHEYTLSKEGPYAAIKETTLTYNESVLHYLFGLFGGVMVRASDLPSRDRGYRGSTPGRCITG